MAELFGMVLGILTNILIRFSAFTGLVYLAIKTLQYFGVTV